MKSSEMQNHLIKIFKRFSMRKDLTNRLYIDLDTYQFKDNIPEEDMWDYYIWVCRELKISNRVMRSHGMDSVTASSKKVGGHDEEVLFEQFGYEVQKGTNKTDLRKDGESFGSLKGGVKIQWGMHVINKLPEKLQKLFGDWISTYGNNFVYLDNRKLSADEIIKQLDDPNERFYLLNYFFRKNENIPYLIVKDVKENIYYRIDYLTLINILVEHMEFYTTKDKVKIVSRINTGEKTEVLFEIEPRADKNNALLMHGQSKVIINIIKHYKINVEETYQ
jgi:hypothetical protein